MKLFVSKSVDFLGQIQLDNPVGYGVERERRGTNTISLRRGGKFYAVAEMKITMPRW